MGLRARLALSLGLVSLGCQGGYPIAPTACDEWCETTQDFRCDFYDPANCVSECEAQNMTDAACRPLFDAALACFQNTPGAAAQRCVYSAGNVPLPCEVEHQNLLSCSIPSLGPYR